MIGLYIAYFMVSLMATLFAISILKLMLTQQYLKAFGAFITVLACLFICSCFSQEELEVGKLTYKAVVVSLGLALGVLSYWYYFLIVDVGVSKKGSISNR